MAQISKLSGLMKTALLARSRPNSSNLIGVRTGMTMEDLKKIQKAEEAHKNTCRYYNNGKCKANDCYCPNIKCDARYVDKNGKIRVKF